MKITFIEWGICGYILGLRKPAIFMREQIVAKHKTAIQTNFEMIDIMKALYYMISPKHEGLY